MRPLPNAARLLVLAALASAPAAQCEVQNVFPADPAVGDFFGLSVGVSGNYAIIGSEFDDDNGTNSGSAYVFRRTSTGWVQHQKLKPADGDNGDRFGFSVDLDGNRAIGTARYNDDLGYGTGSLYVFERTGFFFAQTAKLLPTNAQSNTLFGAGSAISGARVVAGAPSADPAGVFRAGAAYVFENNGSWSQTAELSASDADTDDRFGDVVDIDGTTIVVGAFANDDAGEASGAAYVFEKLGGTWTETAKLTASDAAADARFGVDVAVSGDMILVGALTDGALGANTGAAYVFERQGSTWVEVLKLVAGDEAPASLFGAAVELEGDVAVVGAWGVDSNAGAAYVFERSGSVWTQTARLVPDETKPELDFGHSLGLDGDTVLLGARGDDAFSFSGGSAFFYSRLGTEALALSNCPGTLSLAAGGNQRLDLDLGPGFASALYLVVGSASGTTPGLAGPPPIPLNFDAYMLYTLQFPNELIVNSLGQLGPAGKASAVLSLLPGTDPSLSGLQLHHAGLVLDFPGTGQTLFSTNATSLEFVP